MKERMKLPEAALEHLFYIEVTLHKEEYKVGDVGRGDLVICPISGGRFEGEKLRGQVLDFGADWNLMYPSYLNCVDTRYLLKTDDGALISLSTVGRAAIKPEQDAAMERGEYVDPDDYYFRQHLLFETGDPRYQWLNAACCFAVIGIKDMQTIVYDAYMVK
ncbi:DUF3237 domain-containing protein [Anaerovorax odorimutans]|uniref:DUF3237 domain-containing protein n=1 Tax=Anaerovorax odorimutans TaxID=109327 RepID=A0ABT1RLY0_9FIRM|nr:DUF3237 domain-containing protein [Anaerovorax odorimutans]MCQ4636200.1 DUF3237 domain-containing protein [Anaerovorax odorimutans]